MPSTEPQDDADAGFAVFGSIFLVFMLLMLGPPAVWGRRAYRSIRADLGKPTEHLDGTYVGSWTWRTIPRWLGGRTTGVGLGPFTGLPIAVRDRHGELHWFGLAVSWLPELRQFETAIARGDRRVHVTFHPRSNVLARISSADGPSSLSFESDVDELHPDVGLGLKVGRRRRTAHLPDR